MKLLFIAILYLSMWTNTAWADGFFVWHNKEIDILEPEQKAFVVFDEGVEDLVLCVKFEGAPAEFGWIVPLPSVPVINKPLSDIFETLSRLTQNPYLGMSSSSSMLLKTASIESNLSVETFKVGIYDVAILQNGNLTEISNWLNENQFFLKENAKPILTEYIAKSWVFVAIKIRLEKENETINTQLANGEIQPLAFTFQTEQPIFPLRINAISEKPSEVLIYTLADGGIIPDNTNEIQWETNVRHKAYWRSFTNDRLFHSIRTRFGKRLDSCPLVKSRATFLPDQMQDIEFHPFEPGIIEQSDALRLRAEKATSYGLGTYSNGVELLLDFLKTAKTPKTQTLDQLIYTHLEKNISPGQDIRCAIWALAQLENRKEMTPSQKSEAARLVRHWGDTGCSWTLLEAMKSLEILDAESAADLAMANFEQLPKNGRDSYAKSITYACVQTLVGFGSQRHISPLQAIIEKYYDPDAWSSLWLMKQSKPKGLWLGQLAVQVAAACGDKVSYNELESQLLRTARTSGFLSKYESGKLHFGLYANYYPRALIPGAAILGNHSNNDFVVSDIARYLPENNSLKNDLFRTVAHCQIDTMKIPDDFRAVLISRLDKLNQDDEQFLKNLWLDSLRNPQHVVLPLGKGPGKAKNDLVKYNINALAASYALGVQGRVETLLEFWDQTLWTRLPEKKELAVALALTDSAAALPPLLEYVATVWANSAENKQIQLEMEAEAEENPRHPRVVSLDLLYRQEFINRFLMKFGLEEIEALVTKQNMPPHLRYYFLRHRYFKHHFDSENMIRALEKISVEIQTPNMQKSIKQAMN